MKKRINATIDRDLYEFAKNHTKQYNISISSYICRLIVEDKTKVEIKTNCKSSP